MTMSLTANGAYRKDGVALILTVEQERSPPIEINAGGGLMAVTFSVNWEYLLSGSRGANGVGVWRVEDEKQVARMEATDAWCLAVSKDGRWIQRGHSWAM